MQLNKAMIVGNLTKDLEVKTLNNGNQVCSFSVAVNKSWKDKETGEKKEIASFINCVCFGQRAVALAEWNKKGDKIYVEGEIRTRSWENADGTKGYATEIIVDNWDFVQKKQGVSEDTKYGQYQDQYSAPANTERQMEEELPIVQADEDEINIEDIPF